MSEIQRLDPDNVDIAALTIGKAFANDPAFHWIFPEETSRVEKIRRLNLVAVKMGLRIGHTYTSQGGKALAIWVPPGRKISGMDMMISGMVTVPFRIGLSPFMKFGSIMDESEKIHLKHMTVPHWYLMILVVDPDLQGQGLGSDLVEEGLARVDSDHCGCYLETSEPGNIKFYESFGFTVMEHFRTEKGGIDVWAMHRPNSD